MAVTHPTMSAEDFERCDASPDWPRKIEHLQGEIVVSPPARMGHATVVTQVFARVLAWRSATGDAGLVVADPGVRSGDDSLVPDLAYWAAGRVPPPETVWSTQIPDLVVEIASPSTQRNDQGPKRASYLAAGVREQWLLDPEDLSAIVVDAAGADHPLGSKDVLRGHVLAGFEAVVGDLLGAA